jgi:hypothetical protein
MGAPAEADLRAIERGTLAREHGAMSDRPREESTMNLLPRCHLPRCLQWRRPPHPARVRRLEPDWVGACGEVAGTQPDERLSGCGWFDSSHELHAGLQVTEHLSPERLANELPLGWWLDWQTGGTAPCA